MRWMSRRWDGAASRTGEAALPRRDMPVTVQVPDRERLPGYRGWCSTPMLPGQVPSFSWPMRHCPSRCPRFELPDSASFTSRTAREPAAQGVQLRASRRPLRSPAGNRSGQDGQCGGSAPVLIPASLAIRTAGSWVPRRSPRRRDAGVPRTRAAARDSAPPCTRGCPRQPASTSHTSKASGWSRSPSHCPTPRIPACENARKGRRGVTVDVLSVRAGWSQGPPLRHARGGGSACGGSYQRNRHFRPAGLHRIQWCPL